MGHYSKWIARSHVEKDSRNSQSQAHPLRLNTMLIIVHQAYYRDQGGELRDSNDKVIGHCHTDASDTVHNCLSTRGDINIFGLWYGGSLVYCETAMTACKVFYDPRVDKQC